MSLKLIITGCFLVLTGCTSTYHIQNTDVNMIDGELLQPKWQDLQRTAARYPMAAAMKSKAGCATIEYVITPSYKITNVVVTESSDRVFVRNSKKALYNWKWTNVPQGLIESPIKTRTRFDFCVESNELSCDEVIKNFSCAGTDSISSIGTLVKR